MTPRQRYRYCAADKAVLDRAHELLSAPGPHPFTLAQDATYAALRARASRQWRSLPLAVRAAIADPNGRN